MKMEPEVGIMLPEVKKVQEPPEAARDEEGGRVLLYSPYKEPGPTDTFTLDFQAPELWQNKFLLFQRIKLAVICYGSLGKLIQQLFLR